MRTRLAHRGNPRNPLADDSGLNNWTRVLGYTVHVFLDASV